MIRRMKGTRDILPPESRLWTAVEAHAHRVFGAFGYYEIRLPIAEPTELFVRGVGEGTDIVSKEMYSFKDRSDRPLTLRPEGTAGVARAYIENNMGQWPQPVRLTYLGPMFRYERTQRGRYRQFSQIGLEILGAATPEADLEVVVALHTFLAALGFRDLIIDLNNLGDPEDRERFVEVLKQELEPRREQLCGDCQRRWTENPLRLLDCKRSECQEILAKTTPMEKIASPSSSQHVDAVRRGLSDLGIEVRSAPRLVRGLDYYQRTVFEVIAPGAAGEAVICGGGRYDRLISDLGGPAVPGIGFAIGEDRLIDALPEAFREATLIGRPIALVPLAEGAGVVALRVARELLDRGIDTQTEVVGRSLKASLKWAGKIGARATIIIGEDELAGGVVQLRDMDQSRQEQVPADRAVERICSMLDVH